MILTFSLEFRVNKLHIDEIDYLSTDNITEVYHLWYYTESHHC